MHARSLCPASLGLASVIVGPGLHLERNRRGGAAGAQQASKQGCNTQVAKDHWSTRSRQDWRFARYRDGRPREAPQNLSSFAPVVLRVLRVKVLLTWSRTDTALSQLFSGQRQDPGGLSRADSECVTLVWLEPKIFPGTHPASRCRAVADARVEPEHDIKDVVSLSSSQLLTSTFSGRGGISPRSTRSTWRVIISFVGAAKPARAPSLAMNPFISSISVRRPFAMSCAIEGR